MTRRLLRFATLTLTLLAASAARADVAPSGGGGCGGHHGGKACTVESYQTSTNTCLECTASDQACVTTHEGEGYTAVCSLGTRIVLCKLTATERSAAMLPAAGVLLAVSALASMRLRKRR